MKIRKIQIDINRIIQILTAILLCSFTVFSTYSWGRYVMLICIAAVFVCDSVKNNLKYQVTLNRFIVTLALFAGYAFISSLWAFDASDALTKGKTLFEILFMMFVLYNCYCKNDNNVRELLTVIKWSSFIIVVYSIVFYGMNDLMLMAASEKRIENTYANVNTIGMLAAIGTLIQFDEMMRERKFKFASLLCIPSIFMLAVTQSRKAFVVLFAGFIMILFLETRSKDIRKTILKSLLYAAVGLVALSWVLSLPVFSGILERLQDLQAIVMGTGSGDNSARLRFGLIEVGWNQFFKTPIFGMGIGCPRHLSIEHFGKDAYLHNNFIELLAGGGIIGFSIYYSMYLYLFINFWKYRKQQNTELIICFVIMFLLFAMDYGMVSYYNKIRYVYLMVYFLQVEKLKKNARSSKAENK